MDKPLDCYQFGPFRLYAEKKVLLKDDQPVSLTPKVFETLLVLIENHHRVLSKDEMMELIWPDSFVEESNLSQNISVLRRALGEGAKDSNYIITVSGLGYRFRENALFGNDTIIVEENSTTEIVIEHETIHDPPKTLLPTFISVYQRLFAGRPARQALIMLPLMVGLGAASWWLGSHWSGSRASFRHGELPTAEVVNWKSESAEDYTEASISPFNFEIAYTSMKGGKRVLYTRQISANARDNKITDGTSTDRSPIWSSNGQDIAFISNRGGNWAIWKIPGGGGTALHIWDISKFSRTLLRHWSKDGSTIYFEGDLNLFSFNLNTGEMKPVTSLAREGVLGRYFSVSADETQIAYLEWTRQQFEIWVKPLSGGDAKRILTGPERIHSLVWNPDGKRILFNPQMDGYYQIAELGVDDGKSEQLTFEKTDHFLLDVSANGSRILYNTTKEESNIWGVNLDAEPEFEITSDMAFKFWPDVSPDGQQVVFQSIRNMSMSISINKCSLQIRSIAKPGNQRMLVEDGISPKWSPDGKSIAFLRSRDGKWNIWSIDVAGGPARMLTTRGVYHAGWSQLPYNRSQTAFFNWSADGSKLIYATSDDDKAGIWQVAADGSGETRVVEIETPNAKPYLRLHCPVWSRNERYLSAIKYEESDVTGDYVWSLYVIDLENNQSRSVYRSPLPLRILGWSESGDKVIVANRVGSNGLVLTAADYQILQVSPESGEIQKGKLLESAYLYNMQLSPDGRTLVFDSRQDGRDQFYLMQVATERIQKLTTNSDPDTYFSSFSWTPDGRGFFYSKQQRWNIISMIDQYQ